MIIDVYLKGGQVIRFDHVDEFKVDRANAGANCTGWMIELKPAWKKKPVYIDPSQIAAVVRVEGEGE